MRALEVFLATGKGISYFRQNKKQMRPFSIIKTGLQLPKEQLHKNIDNRTNEMIAEGLVDEVDSLKKYQHNNALQTVGYKEIFSYLNGEYSLETAIEKIQTHTKQYAKRQLTWFKKDNKITWNTYSNTKNILLNKLL